MLRDFSHGLPKNSEVEIKHKTTGHFEPGRMDDKEDRKWSEYILYHVNFVEKTVREAAQRHGGFELPNYSRLSAN